MRPTKVTPGMNPQRASSRATQLVVGAIVLAVMSAGIGYLIAGGSTQPAKQVVNFPTPQETLRQRQATVEANGAQVMPFDLTKTTHVFVDAPDGGSEAVTANNPDDSTQIGLIRMHLQYELGNFNKGNFSDPATTHGKEMPGLAEIEAGVGSFAVTYKDLPAGAQLTYKSSDPVLVTAFHQWFAAQRSDHNSQGGMNMDMNMTPTPAAP